MTPLEHALALDVAETIAGALARFDRVGAPAMILTDADRRPLREVRPIHLRRMLIAGFSGEAPLALLPPAPVVTAAADLPEAAAQALLRERRAETLARIDAEGRLLGVVARDVVEDRILLSPPHMGGEEETFAAEAFATNWIAPLGPNVDAFEAELAAYLGAPAVAAVVSGTAAIHLALRLIGVGPGDTVVASSLTFIGSVAPALYCGARPVFVDSAPSSWTMCPAAFERALARRTALGERPKAAIVTHLYGQSADLDPILEIATAHGVTVIEDAAESLGALYRGRQSGTVAPFGAFSFNGNKIITTSGGGALAARDPEMAARARFLSTQARDPAPHYQHSTYGYNYRLSNILAGVGRGQLRVLDARIAARRRIFELYREGLARVPGLRLMPEPAWGRSNRWLTVATLDPEAGARRGPEAAIAALAEAGIEARPVWKPMHRQPLFADAPYEPHAPGVSVSDRCFEQGLCLPSGSALTPAQIDRICAVIERALA